MIVSWEIFSFSCFLLLASHSDRSLTATSPIVPLVYICNIYPILQSENLSMGVLYIPSPRASIFLIFNLQRGYGRLGLHAYTEHGVFSVNGIQGHLVLCIDTDFV